VASTKDKIDRASISKGSILHFKAQDRAFNQKMNEYEKRKKI